MDSGENRRMGTGPMAPARQRVDRGGVLVEHRLPGPVLGGLPDQQGRAGWVVGSIHHPSSIDECGGGSVTRCLISGSKSLPTAS